MTGCTRLAQEQVSQNPSMNAGGAHEGLYPSKELLVIEGLDDRQVSFSSGTYKGVPMVQ